MKEKINLKWFVFSIVFLGLVTLFLSLLAIESSPIWHNRLLYFSVTCFGVVTLIIVVSLIIDYLKHHKLSEQEKNALKYLLNNGNQMIRADDFSLMYGRDVYLSLLRKGFIENCFRKHRQEVYCRISDDSVYMCNKILH